MAPALDAIAGGWNITSIATFSTGIPIDVTAANTTGFNNITHRTNRLCDGRNSELEDSVRTNGLRWFDTACFSAPASGVLEGNASRNVLYGPGIHNWHIGIEKLFPIPIGEQTRLQFRGEMFNAFNHAQFGQPNSKRRRTQLRADRQRPCPASGPTRPSPVLLRSRAPCSRGQLDDGSIPVSDCDIDLASSEFDLIRWGPKVAGLRERAQLRLQADQYLKRRACRVEYPQVRTAGSLMKACFDRRGVNGDFLLDPGPR